MDFGTLLQTAKQNENQKKEVRSYSTKFAPPKKEDKKDKLLSANIQKFLARKETEEKKKSTEANKKRDELLALRAKDKKATRRVNVMLKRTKSANQSVIDDAVDKDNTAVTLAGPAQPDEDDYGYVSQEASAFYNKMMEKYNKIPEEQKFPDAKKKASSNLSSTKDRVRAALEKEKLDAMMPHKRKRKHREEGDIEDLIDDDNSDDEKVERSEAPPPKIKPKNKAPPPMNFTELLKLASQKQHEPIMIEVKPKDEGPLFTKKQKQEMEKEQQRRGDEKGKLSSDQVNDIRKLPPSHLYKTKRQRSEASRALVHENNEDLDNYEDDEDDVDMNNSSQMPKIQNNHGINRNDKLSKISRDNQVFNRIPKKHSETVTESASNGIRMSSTYSERATSSQLSKSQTDTRLSKTLPERTSDAPMPKPYRKSAHNDAHMSKVRSEGISNDMRSSKMDSERMRPPNYVPTPKVHLEKTLNNARSSNLDCDRIPNNARLSKGATDQLEDSKSTRKVSDPNKNEQSSKASNNKPLLDNRPSKSCLQKPPMPNSFHKNSVLHDNNPKTYSSQSSLKSNMETVRSSTSHKQENNRNKESGISKLHPSNSLLRKNDINQNKSLDKFKNNKMNTVELQHRKPLPPEDRRPKQVPFNNPKPKQFPPPDVMRRKEIQRPRPEISNKRRIIDDDDEEEYDSEMDDFIDDGPEETNDYSTYIREIFGYDKRKYRPINDDDEDDVDNMESSFAQQMREDVRSTKIGIMEDLEDIKREKEEKKRKALKKKGH